MKKIVYILICILLFSLFGCEKGETAESNGSETESAVSAESLEESSEPEESLIDYTEIFDFLNSEYSVSFKKTASDIEYSQTYYFVEGVVAGTKVSAKLGDENAAIEFHKYIQKNYPYCEINGLTVTYYVGDDDDYYEGYTLEKLIFVLEKSGYSYELNFDEKDFYKEFSEPVEE